MVRVFRTGSIPRRVWQHLMSGIDICVRGREEKRGEEQGLKGRDCAPSRTAGEWGQMRRGVEVGECMQLACLTCRCGEVGEVEGYNASGC